MDHYSSSVRVLALPLRGLCKDVQYLESNSTESSTSLDVNVIALFRATRMKHFTRISQMKQVKLMSVLEGSLY